MPKITQLVVWKDSLIALCEDGSMWEAWTDGFSNKVWRRMEIRVSFA